MRENDHLVIGLAGDVMLGRLVDSYLTHDNIDPSYPWGDLLPILSGTNLNIINLETTLTTSKVKVPKVFNFKAHPDKIKVLLAGSIDVVNLANNHSLDFSFEGFIETLNTLDQAHIQHCGAGHTLSEAQAPVILQRNNTIVGILGCTDNEPSWMATDQSPGVYYISVGDIETIQPHIEQLRKQVDILIVTIHWGPNMREKPSKTFITFAHQLIEIGVDVIHGHSAHIFQGIEVYKEKLILYDTGDFIDDYYIDPLLRNDRSFLFLLEIDQKRLRQLRLIPALISNFQVNQAIDLEAEQIIARMQHLSTEFGTSFTRQEKELHLHF